MKDVQFDRAVELDEEGCYFATLEGDRVLLWVRRDIYARDLEWSAVDRLEETGAFLRLGGGTPLKAWDCARVASFQLPKVKGPPAAAKLDGPN
jgi:hypothetical protein